MDVLRLFSAGQPAWTVQAMSDRLCSPASTVYRIVAELVRHGWLEAASESRYRLGAGFVEFDRLTRLSDPLVRQGQGVLRDLVAHAGIPCVGLLSRLYNATVMCVADDAAGSVDFRSSYERGRPMPLTSGATSKAILAQLSPRRLASLLKRHAGEAAPEPLRAELTEIRRRGYVVSRGEIDPGLVGLAAPVTSRDLGLVASLSLVVREAELGSDMERTMIKSLLSSAGDLTTNLGI